MSAASTTEAMKKVAASAVEAAAEATETSKPDAEHGKDEAKAPAIPQTAAEMIAARKAASGHVASAAKSKTIVKKGDLQKMAKERESAAKEVAAKSKTGVKPGEPKTRFSRFPEHDDLAKAATLLVRTGAPTRAGISTRAVGAIVVHLGRKDALKLMGGISKADLHRFAVGEVKLATLSDDTKGAVKSIVQALRSESGLKALDGRELAAVLDAKIGKK